MIRSTIADYIDAARRKCHLSGTAGDEGMWSLDVADTLVKKGYGLHDDVTEIVAFNLDSLYSIPQKEVGEIEEHKSKEEKINMDAIASIIRIMREYNASDSYHPHATISKIQTVLDANECTTTQSLRENSTNKNNKTSLLFESGKSVE